MSRPRRDGYQPTYPQGSYVEHWPKRRRTRPEPYEIPDSSPWKRLPLPCTLCGLQDTRSYEILIVNEQAAVLHLDCEVSVLIGAR